MLDYLDTKMNTGDAALLSAQNFFLEFILTSFR